METKPLSLVHRIQPPRRPVDGPPPALALFHGTGGDERDLLDLGRYFDPRLFLISPRGTVPFQAGGHRWFPPLVNGRIERSGLIAGIDKVARFVDEAVDAYGLDPRQVYGLGFSNGAAIAMGLALTRPGTLAGVVSFSGLIPFDVGLEIDPQALAGTGCFVAHGLHDPITPVDHARRARDFLAALPIDLEYREYPIGHELAEAEVRDADAWLTRRLDGRPAHPSDA